MLSHKKHFFIIMKKCHNAKMLTHKKNVTKIKLDITVLLYIMKGSYRYRIIFSELKILVQNCNISASAIDVFIFQICE